ncbi:response regulator [Marinagarivorans algicola]|uniref:response regulator n=1 Tax=Marinagarivorans algicola TaxID=1513270 RepID=UPI000B2B363E
MNKPILLVDDDIELCALLSEYLTGEGFAPAAVHSGEQALTWLAQEAQSVSAIVLDIMMPGMSGLELLQVLRQGKGITAPIIMLTGRGDDIDRIVGLEMGADDYMGKPCNPRELAARLRAIIRRSDILPVINTLPISLHGINLDVSTLTATCRGQPLNLTGAEFNVLRCFLLDAGKVLSKAKLTQQALSREYTQYDRSIDVHVSRIRHKLAQCDVFDVIRAVRGQGYQLVMPDEQ